MTRARKSRRDQCTAMERGAAMAYVAATERLHKLRAETQPDLFVSRAALVAEWTGIKSAAALALA